MTTAVPPAAPPPRRARVVAAFAPLLVGTVIAAVILNVLADGPLWSADDLALGKNTVSVFATRGGDPIHCQDLDPEPADRYAEDCLDAAVARGSGSYALWLGNSQVHGVNRLQPEDSTGAQLLADALAGRGVDLVTLSQPNANLQEHYVVFEYVRDRLPDLEYLVLPVVFDDTREDGVRNRLAAAFDRPGVVAALRETEPGQALTERYGPAPGGAAAPGGAEQEATPSATDADFAALDETVQESTETWLNDRLADLSETWRLRPSFRGRLFEFFYLARNSVLGIDPSTVRPLAPGPYAANLAALGATLRAAREGGVEVLVYVAPIRNDTDIPYNPDEYTRFQEDVGALATEHSAVYANIEGIVPGPMWGMKASTNLSGRPEYDFMHFTADGHRLLADALHRELDQRVLTDAPRATP